MIIWDKTKKFLFSTKINNENYFSGFGTRLLGDSRNRGIVESFFNHSINSYKNIIIPKQVHETNIIEINHLRNKKIVQVDKADGLITRNKSSILTIQTADCVPIIFVDKIKGVIGISHQGWKGSLMRMSQKMIKEMIGIGGGKQSLQISIGPSIGDCCYYIDEDRYQKFKKEFNNYFNKIIRVKKQKKYLNLGLLNFLQLQEIGISKDQIDFFPFCTQCDENRFFSYRRQKKSNYSQMVSFVVKL